MKFTSDKRRVVHLRLVLLAIAVLAAAACSSNNNPGTGTTTGTVNSFAGSSPGTTVPGKGMTSTGSGGKSGTTASGGTGAPVSTGSSGAKSSAGSPSVGASGTGTTITATAGTPGASGSGAPGASGSGASGSGASGSGSSTGPSASNTDKGDSSCLDMITDYEKDGPFMVQTMVAGAVNFWIPMVPSGCKVPVIHLSNGTGATCSVYGEALNRMATQGFLASCYEDPNTGAGDDGVMAIDAAITMFPDLAAMKLGSTGHSQGGQAAFTTLQLLEAKYMDKAIYAGLAMEPASGFGIQPTGGTWQMIYSEIKSPMFMFSGLGTDGLVSQVWVQEAYDATAMSEEAYFWTANGATHIPVPNGEEEEISIPWFRWKLLGDQKACMFFKQIPMTDMKWAEVASKNSQPCM